MTIDHRTEKTTDNFICRFNSRLGHLPNLSGHCAACSYRRNQEEEHCRFETASHSAADAASESAAHAHQQIALAADCA